MEQKMQLDHLGMPLPPQGITKESRTPPSKSLKVYYTFLIQRPSDSNPWPMIFENLGQAEGYPARVSKVYEIPMEKVGG